MVYVLSQNGQPLMPTENPAKVRVLLKQRKAKVVKNVRLQYNYCMRARLIHRK